MLVVHFFNRSPRKFQPFFFFFYLKAIDTLQDAAVSCQSGIAVRPISSPGFSLEPENEVKDIHSRNSQSLVAGKYVIDQEREGGGVRRERERN